MQRFEPDRYYRPADEAMRLIATEGTLAVWRHEDRGPRYTKFGNRVLYLGSDLNSFLDQSAHEPRNGPAPKRQRAAAIESRPAA